MAQARSVTTFVMSAELPWPDETSPADALGALDGAALIAGGQRRDCAIRRISALGTTLRGTMTQVPGDAVAVELATGQRPAGTVEWVAGGEAGVRFHAPIDMLALLNRTLIAQPGERRTMPRVELRCAVGIKWGASVAAATLRNISARGLQVEGANGGDDLPDKDTFVSLYIDGLVVPTGEVVWRKGALAVIELFEELRWSSLMPWVREVGRKG